MAWLGGVVIERGGEMEEEEEERGGRDEGGARKEGLGCGKRWGLVGERGRGTGEGRKSVGIWKSKAVILW